MEDRYEIFGKIGQVGICPVYRAYDIRMGREVAIKRILSRFDNSRERENTNKQIVAETNAIASLQHPHIVRIFDLGMDGAEPYVVTELITGRRLDEIIASAPLIWPDFREFAMQTQEALIAAQDFNMIHGELKPSSIMVTWLASGKFQVKVMDFGLAALYRSQTTNGIEVDQFDFDSMFFMSPEQFESKPLDARSDLYSMGCVYYYALTGTYPYTGNSSSELMSAHLQHRVTPIQDLRKGVPIWLCDWVMWLINRYPQDRPESAREALSVFIQNDSVPKPKMSLGIVKSKRPPLDIPGASKSLDLISPKIVEPKSLDHWRLGFEEIEAVNPLIDASKNETAKLSSPHDELKPNASSAGKHVRSVPKLVKKKYTYSPAGTAHKLNIPTGKRSIAAIAGLVSAIVFIFAAAGWMLYNYGEKQLLVSRSNELIALAGPHGINKVMMDKSDLDLLLQRVSTTSDTRQREAIYDTLKLAKSTDGTDINACIESFVSLNHLPIEVQNKLIREVLKMRSEATVIADSPKVVAAVVNSPKVDPPIVDTPKVATVVAVSEPDKSVALQSFTGWTPAQLVCAAWYDAADASTIHTDNAATVYRWDDKSGNGRHQRQGTATLQPTTGSRSMNGVNVLNFQSDYMESSLQNIPSGTFSVYTVMQYDSASYGAASAWGANGTTGYISLGAGSSSQFNCSIDNAVAFSGSPYNGPSVYGITYDNGGTKSRKGYVDGVEKASTSYVTPYTDFSANLRLMAKGGNIQTVSGGLAEFIIVPDDATLETRQKIEGYLAHKWGLVAQLPANHPYKNVAP